MNEKFILLCAFCSWKKISDLKDDVVELNNDSMSGKKYKCEKCGRAIVPKKIKDPQSELNKKIKEKEIEEENKNWMKENVEFRKNFLKDKNE